MHGICSAPAYRRHKKVHRAGVGRAGLGKSGLAQTLPEPSLWHDQGRKFCGQPFVAGAV
jgi:hypothetical protein